MARKGKKTYQKPEVTRLELRAEELVLTRCKTVTSMSCSGDCEYRAAT